MFASAGYFRGLPCPYFASGLCERKYCHFRHVKQPDDTNDIAFHSRLASAAENGTLYQPPPGPAPVPQRHSSLLGMMGSAIQQVQRDTRHDTPKYCINKPPGRTTLATQPVSYQPTPIVKGGAAVAAKRDITAKRNTMEYNPTPIPLLRQLHEQRKQDIDGASEMEYDPLTNFSTNGPSESWCTTRVTLGDAPKYEAAPKRKCDWIVENSNKKMRSAHDHSVDSDSDDDVDAQFSDDDDDERGTSSHVEKSKMSDTKMSKTSNETKRTNTSCAEVGKANKKVDLASGTVATGSSGDRKPVLALLQESLSSIVDSDSSSVKIKQESETDCLKMPLNGVKKELCEDVREGKGIGNEFAEKSNGTSKTSSGDKKRTLSKKPSSDKHSHRDSKSSKSSSSSDKHRSSSDKNKTNSSSSSGSKHRHSSTTKHTSHTSKNGKSSSESTHSSGSKSHSSGRRHHHGSGSSSSKENSSGKSKHSVTPATSRSNSLPTDNLTDTGHLCDVNGKGLGRSLSHADLFGDDSDSDCVVTRPGGDVAGAPIQLSDDSNYDEDVMLVSPERPPVEDFSEPEDLYDECLSIFNEKSEHCSDGHVKSTEKLKTKAVEEDDIVTAGKTRVARLTSADSSVKRVMTRHPASFPSPAEVMHNRLRQMQEKQKQTTNTATNGNISKATHVALERRTACNLPNRRLRDMSSAATECTITASKVASRVAHAAKQTAMPRPTIPAEFGSKVPTSIRQRYLSLMVDECLKIYPTPQDAYDRALSEEKVVYDRSSGRNIYLRVAVNAIKKLRSEVSDMKTVHGGGATSPRVRTHEAVLGGLKAQTTSFTVKRCGTLPKCQDEFKGADLYRRLTPYILTEEQLVENGFPRPGTDRGQVSLKIPEGKQLPKPNSNSRLCCRCGTRFDVLPSKEYAKKEQCVYHWGKCWKKKVAGSIDSRYTCCGGDLGTPGCAVSEWHAYETNKYLDLSGYMKTIPGSPRPRKDYDVYSMDCEMVYTMGGSELARVTVIGPDLQPVFEKLVKPDHRIIDYNTRFSGLTERDLAGVETTLRDVQAVLLSLFTDKTILIGHSLESDLVALKLIHSTVVDTSVVFPHRMGAPYKRALRTLMADFLQRIIQNDVGGHDSSEDAIACMELMLWQLKEDARKEART